MRSIWQKAVVVPKVVKVAQVDLVEKVEVHQLTPAQVETGQAQPQIVRVVIEATQFQKGSKS
jgi:hypothetical protein